MSSLDEVIAPHAFRVSTALTAVIASWFALTFAISVGGLFLAA